MSDRRWTSQDFAEQYEYVIKRGHDCGSVVDWLREAQEALTAAEAHVAELEAAIREREEITREIQELLDSIAKLERLLYD